MFVSAGPSLLTTKSVKGGQPTVTQLVYSRNGTECLTCGHGTGHAQDERKRIGWKSPPSLEQPALRRWAGVWTDKMLCKSGRGLRQPLRPSPAPRACRHPYVEGLLDKVGEGCVWSRKCISTSL